MTFHIKVFMTLLILMVLAWFGYLTHTVSMLVPGFVHVCQAIHLLGYIATPKDGR